MSSLDPAGRDDPGKSVDPNQVKEMAALISTELAALHRECYGEDVREIQTHILPDAIVCIIDIRLLTHERTLLDNGRGHAEIRQVRQQFQETITSSFVATVEHMTGRRVVSFLSDTSLEPAFSVEFFRLGPVTEVELEER